MCGGYDDGFSEGTDYDALEAEVLKVCKIKLIHELETDRYRTSCDYQYIHSCLLHNRCWYEEIIDMEWNGMLDIGHAPSISIATCGIGKNSVKTVMILDSLSEPEHTIIEKMKFKVKPLQHDVVYKEHICIKPTKKELENQRGWNTKIKRKL